MRVTVTVPDEKYDEMVAKWGETTLPKRWLEAMIAFKEVKLGDRALVIHGKTRQDIEAQFETTLETPEKLLKLVSAMNRVKIGDLELKFTEDELARLQMQATFHGRTLEVFIMEMIAEIKARMLEQV
jgi:hypothetical protein